MNNVNKLIKDGLRKKYFRTPTLNDIQVEFKDNTNYGSYYITLKIGGYSKYKTYQYKFEDRTYWNEKPHEKEARKKDCQKNTEKMAERRNICNLFNGNKSKENLQKICEILKVKYTTIMKPGYQKMLLNQEGVEFVKALIMKLMIAKEKLIGVVEDMKNLQAEISVVDPYGKSIYNEDNNRHIRDLGWTINQLKKILQRNGAL